MKSITNLDEFMDAVITLSEQQPLWETKVFMERLNKLILKGLKTHKTVSTDVFAAWYHIHILLETNTTRSRIRSTAQGVKSWLSS